VQKAATALDAEALYSTHEANYAAIQKERDDLRRRLAENDADSRKRRLKFNALETELEWSKREALINDTKKATLRGAIRSKTAAKEDGRRRLSGANKRADRGDSKLKQAHGGTCRS